MVDTSRILQGDSLSVLKTLPEKSINMCMTSPPYWALRDYGSGNNQIWDGDEKCEHDFEIVERQLHSGTLDVTKTVHHALKVGALKTDWKTKDGFCNKCGAWKGQLGLEPTFDLYIKHLCDIFEEVKRVLRDDGTCWVNLGDTYYGGGKDGKYCKKGISDIQLGNKGSLEVVGSKFKSGNYTDKCLTMIPQRFAIEMVNRGWILRNVIIWHKPNCMPSPVKDRFTVDFEYIFFFSKKKKYYFETQYEPLADITLKDPRINKGAFEYEGKRKDAGRLIQNRMCGMDSSKGRNKRTVWRICPKPFKEAHFAVYPEELCETPIKAGCPEFVCVKCGSPKILDLKYKSNETKKDISQHTKYKNSKEEQSVRQDFDSTRVWKKPDIIDKGYKPTCKCNVGFTSGIVLDPFFGAGTTGLVSLKQNKKFVGIELNSEYIKIAETRIKTFLKPQPVNKVKSKKAIKPKKVAKQKTLW